MKHHQKTEVNEDTYLLQETTTQEKPTKVIKKTYEPITDVKPALLNHLNDVKLLEISTKSSPSYIPRLELIEFLTQDTYRKRLE